jgi:hypothetical protein
LPDIFLSLLREARPPVAALLAGVLGTSPNLAASFAGAAVF